jgi:methyl-accepting chemotaxis protein
MNLKQLIRISMIANAILVIVGVASLIYLLNTSAKQEEALKLQTAVAKNVASLNTVSDQLTSDIRSYVATDNAIFIDSYNKEVDAQTYAKLIKQFDTFNLPADLMTYVKNVQAESGALVDVEMSALDAHKAGKDAEATNLLYGAQYLDAKSVINENLATFNEQSTKWIDNQVAAAQSAKNLSQILIVVSLLLLSGSLTFMLWIFSRRLKPLYALGEQSHKVAEGDLTLNPLPVKTKDEIGDVTEAFNTMYANLKMVIRGVQETSTELAASAEQLSTNTNHTSTATQQVTESIEAVSQDALSSQSQINESSVALTELSTGITQIAEHASTTAELTGSANEHANNSGIKLNQTISQMRDVEQAVVSTTTTIQSLSENSRDIEEIIQTITEIADQTNLLALNANIEAARAGESGKGFAVVADEVRKLAEESNKSALQIADIIKKIQGSTETTVSQMEDVATKVKDGMVAIDDTSSAFTELITISQEILQSVTEVSATSQQIAASTQQVSDSIGHISEASDNTTQQTQQVAGLAQEQYAAIEEITAASDFLRKLSEDLTKQVSHFRI